jgi:hypothetical protein
VCDPSGLQKHVGIISFCLSRGQSLALFALESERAKALIVGEDRQQPVGSFDDFVDRALVAVISQTSCGFR